MSGMTGRLSLIVNGELMKTLLAITLTLLLVIIVLGVTSCARVDSVLKGIDPYRAGYENGQEECIIGKERLVVDPAIYENMNIGYTQQQRQQYEQGWLIGCFENATS